MVYSGTINITLVGGVVPNGNSGSAILDLGVLISIAPNPITQTQGQTPNVGGRLNVNPKANVIMGAAVSINPPSP